MVSPTSAAPLAGAQAMTDFLATMQPKTDGQKAALATANQFVGMIEQSRLLMSLQVASPPVSWGLVAVLIFWNGPCAKAAQWVQVSEKYSCTVTFASALPTERSRRTCP